MLVGVSWRESLLNLLRRERLRRLKSITVSSSTVEQGRFYSNKNNMPSSDIIDCTGANSSQSVELRFAKLTENAVKPTRGSKLAAGFDLHSAYDYVIPASGKVVALTDLQIALPSGCYGRIAPRSGLAAKHFIDVGAGVIDQDYRGNVGVVLFNFGQQDFKVSKGDRIAQLILERIFIPELVEMKSLEDTERGNGGFGSTGQQ